MNSYFSTYFDLISDSLCKRKLDVCWSQLFWIEILELVLVWYQTPCARVSWSQLFLFSIFNLFWFDISLDKSKSFIKIFVFYFLIDIDLIILFNWYCATESLNLIFYSIFLQLTDAMMSSILCAGGVQGEFRAQNRIWGFLWNSILWICIRPEKPFGLPAFLFGA